MKITAVISHYKITFIAFCVFSLAAVLLFYILAYGHSWYPMGWDAGYYMSQVRMLVEGKVTLANLVSPRSGYMLFSALIIKLTGFSVQTAEIIIPDALLIILSGIAAGITKKISGKWSISVLTFILHLFIYRLLRMTQSLSANLLAITILYSLIWFFLKYFAKPKILIPIMLVGLALIGLTHTETLLFALLFFFIVGVLTMIVCPKKISRPLASLYFFIVPACVILLALFLVPNHTSISALAQSYVNSLYPVAETSLANTGVPLVQQEWWTVLMGYLRMYGIDILTVLATVGSAALLVKRRQLWSYMLLAWMLVVIGITSIAIGHNTFVYQRTDLLWPQPMLIILGFAAISKSIKKPTQRMAIIAAVSVGIITSGTSYARNFQLWFPRASIMQLKIVDQKLISQPDNLSWDVLVYKSPNTNDQNTTYYKLWADNIGAAIHSKYTRSMCVYADTYEGYLAYLNNREREKEFSIVPGTRQLCQRAPSGNVIIVQALYVPWTSEIITMKQTLIRQLYRDPNVIIGRRI